MKHVCEIIYNLLPNKVISGTTKGICRITGKESIGISFSKWMRPTFTDYQYLHEGTIISNEAAFCFLEKNKEIQELTNRDKPQNFRTYSHIVCNGKWYLLTKGQKDLMLQLLFQNPTIFCIAESGQKHILFKHRIGFWQLEELLIEKNEPLFKLLHTNMYNLSEGFSQNEILTGNYKASKILKFGCKKYIKFEHKIKQYRGSKIFNFAFFFFKTKPNYE